MSNLSPPPFFLFSFLRLGQSDFHGPCSFSSPAGVFMTSSPLPLRAAVQPTDDTDQLPPAPPPSLSGDACQKVGGLSHSFCFFIPRTQGISGGRRDFRSPSFSFSSPLFLPCRRGDRGPRTSKENGLSFSSSLSYRQKVLFLFLFFLLTFRVEGSNRRVGNQGVQVQRRGFCYPFPPP